VAEARKIAPRDPGFHNPRMGETTIHIAAEHQCRCAWPGCALPGLHRAPKDRSLSDYVFYCLDHVRAYNASWDFHAGLEQGAIESELRSAATWDRPTWKMGALGNGRDPWRSAAINDPFGMGSGTAFDPRARSETRGAGWSMALGLKSEHRRAMQTLDLEGPFTLTELKARYKALVKRHHPDANAQRAESQRGGSDDRMKAINAAYALLKQSLDDRARSPTKE
jgi:hypothetical protein